MIWKTERNRQTGKKIREGKGGCIERSDGRTREKGLLAPTVPVHKAMTPPGGKAVNPVPIHSKPLSEDDGWLEKEKDRRQQRDMGLSLEKWVHNAWRENASYRINILCKKLLFCFFPFFFLSKSFWVYHFTICPAKYAMDHTIWVRAIYSSIMCACTLSF